MSQFIDRLNRVAKAAPQPMGFHRAKSLEARPQMLLIVVLADTETGLAERLTGADAALVRATGVKTLQKMARSLSRVSWGVWTKDGGKELEPMVEAGADFAVFPASAATAAAPQGNKIGKIIQVEPGLGDTLLRAINDLPVDAALISGEWQEEDSLTWQHLLAFQRAASLLTKPLLVTAPAGVSGADIEILWGIGVDGIVVEASQSAGRLEALREAISKAAESTKRRRGKSEARVTSTRMDMPAETSEEEEDE